ncbi:hypothetical protein PULV_a0375 [Pseudoalteromonas ulvae UL12]|uniref:hypothetical protein n=1 Tax=Pseudoalteromonas ulvae TaxID=107327 RepID=UPI00186B70A5|nr:hypothetical protein [Pseudoalteromonas ulvae]MBE0362801.1 hypothetical protein [Pseudoalteromonas ulvae UL12]
MSWLKWIYIVLSAAILVMGQTHASQSRTLQSQQPSYQASALFYKIRQQFYLTYQIKKPNDFFKQAHLKHPLRLRTLMPRIERFWPEQANFIRSKWLRSLLRAKATQQK